MLYFQDKTWRTIEKPLIYDIENSCLLSVIILFCEPDGNRQGEQKELVILYTWTLIGRTVELYSFKEILAVLQFLYEVPNSFRFQ